MTVSTLFKRALIVSAVAVSAAACVPTERYYDGRPYPAQQVYYDGDVYRGPYRDDRYVYGYGVRDYGYGRENYRPRPDYGRRDDRAGFDPGAGRPQQQYQQRPQFQPQGQPYAQRPQVAPQRQQQPGNVPRYKDQGIPGHDQ